MKIVFMGTPEFAVPSLEKLIDEFDVVSVFTQPDRPKGRGKKLAFSPVKECAVKYNVPVYQPEKLRKEEEYIEILKKLQPDFIIVVAYGQILPKEVLDIPKYACINLHASLLPKYRGAAPINYAVINGEKVSGNTTMLMDVGLDTGDILLKQEVQIDENMTSGELHDKLMGIGGELLVDTINGYAKGEIKPEKQDDSKSCYASMLNKDMAKINWKDTAYNINNLIRGLNPWPVAYTSYKNENMKIYNAKVINSSVKGEPGKIKSVSKDGIEVFTGEGVLLIKVIQFPGGKAMEIGEYIKGHAIDEGSNLV